VKLAPTLAATLLLAIAPPAFAVDEGAPDRDRHPNVGLLGFDVDGAGPTPPALLCSGSVLSERAFLTAAHCISAFPADAEWSSRCSRGAPRLRSQYPGSSPTTSRFR